MEESPHRVADGALLKHRLDRPEPFVKRVCRRFELL